MCAWEGGRAVGEGGGAGWEREGGGERRGNAQSVGGRGCVIEGMDRVRLGCSAATHAHCAIGSWGHGMDPHDPGAAARAGGS